MKPSADIKHAPGETVLAVPVERGDPLEHPSAYRQCLGQFATGVTIMTTEVEGCLGGVTANSYASVSLDPPLVLWSIARTSRSFHLFAQAKHFAVNVLDENQISVARHFSGSATDKFADMRWHGNERGVPLIEGALASLECSVEALHEGGDHLIIVGRVKRYTRFQGRPLLFMQGVFGVGGEHPGAVLQPTRAACEGERPAPVLLHLLSQAWHQLVSEFEEHRAAQGLSVAQGQIIGSLAAEPGLCRPHLQLQAGLSTFDVDYELADLQNRGLVEVTGDRLRLTESGERCRQAVASRWAEFQTQRLQNLSSVEVTCLLAALAKIVADSGSGPRAAA